MKGELELLYGCTKCPFMIEHNKRNDNAKVKKMQFLKTCHVATLNTLILILDSTEYLVHLCTNVDFEQLDSHVDIPQFSGEVGHREASLPDSISREYPSLSVAMQITIKQVLSRAFAEILNKPSFISSYF